MITFTQFGNLGRLGNQLFQYALLKSISLKTGKEIVLPNYTKDYIWHSQKCLMSNFKISCHYSDFVKPKFIFKERFQKKFDNLVYSVPEDTDFYGFFQSHKYFHQYRSEILKEFEFKDEIEDKANEIIYSLKQKQKNIVSVHFRRGDLISTNAMGPTYLGPDGNISKDCVLGRYIDTATSHFDEDETLFYVISGGSREGFDREDIEWCKRNFTKKNVIYSEGISDILEFAILTKVDANICSHGSTFGWWAAYLNKNQKVISPKKSLIIEQVDHTEYYPDNWILI